MATIPSSVALASILDGSQIVASDHRNNYSSVQTAINALITMMSGGSNGQVFMSSGGTTVGWGTAGTIGNELDYKQIIADVTGITATSEGTAAAVITGNSVTYDGTKNRIEFWLEGDSQSAADSTGTYVLLRDATVLGQVSAPVSSTIRFPIYGVFYDTPSAGSHTYALKAFVSAGTLTVKAGAGGSGALLPSFLRVTKA